MSNQLEEYRSRLRESLGIINELKAKVAAAERAKAEPIAIVGMSCRLPGGCTSIDAFWDGLLRGVDGVGEVPATRWPATDIEGAGADVRWAALIDGIDQFDAAFFGISPREAASLDPQHRLLLEVSWEAIEDAGLRAESLIGSKTGVYLGICTNDYWHGIVRRGTPSVDTYGATGNLLSTAAGRISYWLGLEGPCASIDTACSSSLVALNLACTSLQNGTSDQALVGGVNAILSPFSMTMMSRVGALSQDGRCKTFDARANGYVRGEGCGIIVLKRLSDARRDGDRIRAVILGSAVNQDGRSTGLTTPNVLSQQALLRQALESARLSPEDIGYIETHGTGTPLGDPIEVDALKAVFGRPRQNQSPCILGALKTNIGHLEGAAGVAGLIKTILSLEHQQIPKNLHQRALNPRIDIEGTPFVIPREKVPWPRGAKPRRVGISSFGISGTNAHVILEEAPAELPSAPNDDLSAYLLPISAKTPAALAALARSYAAWFAGDKEIHLEDAIFTASVRRTHHAHRLAVVARTRGEFANTLGSFIRNESPAGIVQGRVASTNSGRLLFVFSGQGSQWAGMGKTLLAEEPLFRAKLEEIDVLIQQHARFSLLEEISAADDRSRLGETEIAQPALFGLQVALAELFKSWGIVPDAVVGHSVGEVAAAHICGALTLEDAVRLVVLRGRIMQKATGNGKMVWAALPADSAMRVLAGREDQVAVAAINDPTSVVLSGESDAIDKVVAGLEQREIVTRPLRVNYAFHSPQMDPLARELIGTLGQLNAKTGSISHYSTVTGALVNGTALAPEYWGRNVRATVNLAEALRVAIGDGYRTLVEIGPHPVLLANLQQCASAQNVEARVLPSLRRNAEERRSLLETLGALHVNGAETNWKTVSRRRGRVVALPSYTWQKERFWVEPLRRTNTTGGKGIHPLLGTRFDSSIAPGEHIWQQSLSVDAFAYLADHRVQGEVVFPGTGYVEMAIAATAAVYSAGTVIVDEMSLHQILALAPDTERQVQIVLQKDGNGSAGIAISSRGENEESWTRHATIRVRMDSTASQTRESIQTIETRCAEMVEHAAHYTRMDARGLNYGPAFRGVQYLRKGDGEILGRVSLPESTLLNITGYQVHPALLDACLQAASWTLETRIGNAAIVPKEFIGLRYHARPSRQGWVHGRFLGTTEDGALSIGIVVYDDDGRVLIEIGEMRVAAVEGRNLPAPDPFDDWLYQLAWRAKDLAANPPTDTRAGGSWLVFGDSQGVGRAVANVLRKRGQTCVEAIAATSYGRAASGEYHLDPTDPNHLRQMLGEAFGSTRVCKGVLHALSLDSTPWDKTTPESLSIDLRRNCMSVVRLTQALLTQGWRDLPRLYMLTRGVHSIDPTERSIGVSQAPLWGLGRTIALEHPSFECTRIDLPASSTNIDVENVGNELLSSNTEDQIALRSSGRFVARLVRDTINAIPARDFKFHADRTYLITGGLGGLGLEIANWMVQQGVRHLMLVGRNAPNARAADVIQSMTQAGANVRIAQADISQRQGVIDVLATQKHEMPPLAGIIHAAAVLEDRTLLDVSEEEFMRVMQAKVFGALHLHALTEGQQLDFFVAYSSVAGVLGSPGQGNYAAANAFLDAFSRARVAAGLPATSIAWGPFTDVGFAAARDDRGKRLAGRGIEGISPADGNAILEKLLIHPRAEVAAVRLSVRQWQEVLPQAASLPMLAELRTEIANPDAARDGAQSFRRLLESTEASRRGSLIQAFTVEQLGKILRLDPSRIDSLATFASLGVDSLTSLELRNRLQTSLGLDLQATLLFTYPTIDKLVTHIIGKLAFDEPAAPAAQQTAPLPQEKAAEAEPPADMEVDDLLALLDEELNATKKRG